MKLLGYRARTEKELRERLAGKKYEVEEVDEVLTKLIKANLINDQELARNYVRDKLSISRRGPRRIYFELIRRGVAKDVADHATKEIQKDDELKTAQDLLQSRQRQWAKLDPLKRKHRAIGLLARRGFSADVLSQLLKEL
ncbi:MAG: RecX family transcriptional regulator [Candidatus Berkelbacteria bacterium]|nr:RecX family transcriptional regulator [Candidatus Berkelbacteria bacterium]MCR4307394.1 RecX family transcriptional regulator [Candidatus Berkelbacteria bacterium]